MPERGDREARIRAEAAADRLARLQQVTAALSAAATSEEAAEAIFQVGLDALGAAGGSLSFGGADGLAQVAHTAGFFAPARRQPAALQAALEEAFAGPEAVWLESAAEVAARYPGVVRPGHALTEGAWAALPLAAGGRCLGVLGLGFPAPRRFPPEDRAFMRAMAQETAQALLRTRLHEEQRRLRAEAEAAAEERERLVADLRRTLRERDESVALQRQVLAVVGHDLRSPLLAITSSAAMLQHGEALPERAARAVRRILSAATRMDGIVRALADYARVQVGHGIPLERRPVEFRELAREVAAEMEAAHPGRTVRCQVPEAEPGEWDPDRLGQVVANLLGNALEHGAPDAQVTLSCRGDPETLAFEVSNQGPPIPAGFRPQLFEPFRRGPGAEKAARGLGLGLFIARQIVLAHGGAIEARSDEASGTAFAVRLPRRPPAA